MLALKNWTLSKGLETRGKNYIVFCNFSSITQISSNTFLLTNDVLSTFISKKTRMDSKHFSFFFLIGENLSGCEGGNGREIRSFGYFG